MRVHKLSSPVNQRKATVFMNEEKESFEEREKAIKALIHEIRNPLTAIKLANHLMQEAFEGEEQSKLLMQSYVMIIANNVEKIEKHLKEVLTYKRRECVFDPVNICECIDKALHEVKDRLHLGGITVNNNYNGSYWVYGDEEKLVTVFLNILVNSIEAIKKENGRIWISVYETNNTVRITFKDDGSGMEPSIVQKIFDEDFSTKDGIGIGLSNVKEIMTMHKANIIADSLPGVGTSITILFKSIPGEQIPTMMKRTSGPASGDHYH
jgi:signal transduction histidine kinase